MKRFVPVLAATLSALLVASVPAQATGSRSLTSYGTKASYAPQQNAHGYQRAPRGYRPVFTETVSRHGSRAATSSKDGDLVLALWDRAAAEDQLTSTGRRFGPDVRTLLAAMATVGYGNLSGRGEQELRDTAARLEQRLPGLFQRIAENGEPIDVVTSGEARAVASGTVFTGALASGDPALAPLIRPARSDRDLLYFHKSAGGAAYRDYVDHDQRLATTLKDITEQPATAPAARRVLERIFKPAFVQRVVDGAFSSVASDVDAARAVYNLYAIAPSLSAEMPDHRALPMERYIAPRDAAWFGYLSDAEDFYEKGPGFADSDITYRMAGVLLDDFFRQAEAKRAGTSALGAELRFTHAEEIIPLAALMGLPGSTVAATPDRPYTYADNPWRGASVSPMAANIQWDVFRKGDTYLVRMLYNEKETAFKPGCRPVSRGSAFYDLDELERCFGRAS
ncbi:histidine-type phosphatase [Streptomyces longwoodensis]|uniref:histidine-type phosphatase n=1 Tax=Streptomyces longwoodensis TaxID=68231 RepID=UPI0033B63F8F